MIEIKNVNKYFNKHRKNQIHVINNTSLSLESTGLVALLGPSGSGKTTLLNSIGGLDKISNGSIYVDGMKISSKYPNKVDKIRNLNVGYIFQDYKLIDNLSVYDNVALVLTMIGLKNKSEIKTRVEYVLDKVGMLRYKRRPAGMLSGGERQRVGIARAIVKDPNIILADEPTGNLDSKNSLEIMKIIKAISKDRLVILVTHEQELAKFYASRIIELMDGQIVKDYPNDNTNDLDYQIDNTFYLKDFKNDVHLLGNKINIYTNSKENINLDIVVRNGNIYIKSNNNYKSFVIDDNSNIEFVNEHYKKIAKEDIDKYNFNFKNIINNDFKKKYSSIFNPISLIVNGFKKVFDYSFLKKLLLIGFFLSGMFIMYAVSSIASTLEVNDKDFVTINKEYLIVDQKNTKVEDYLEYEKMEDINYILPGDSSVTFNIKYNDYYQTSTIVDSLTGSLSDISSISEKDIIYGKNALNENEIVVDIFAINKMFNKSSLAQMSGIKNVEELLGRNVTINNMNDFTIVGIVDKGSPSIYAFNNQFINIIANSNNEDNSVIDYNLYSDKIIIKEGRIPSNDYEAIVNINEKENKPLNKPITTKINDKSLIVVGYYTSKWEYNYLLVNNNTVKYNVIKNKNSFVVNSSDKTETLTNLREKNLNIKDSYIYSKEEYKKSMKDYVRNSLLVSGIIIVISLIEIFLMMRSSFLSRIKEIGIYRAIGVKKSDIYKMFFGEIFAITTLASVTGLILMSYIIKVLTEIKYLENLFVINERIIIISVIFIYLFNIIIGLIPVFNTIRKSPAAILSRHDLD